MPRSSARLHIKKVFRDKGMLASLGADHVLPEMARLCTPGSGSGLTATFTPEALVERWMAYCGVHDLDYGEPLLAASCCPAGSRDMELGFWDMEHGLGFLSYVLAPIGADYALELAKARAGVAAAKRRAAPALSTTKATPTAATPPAKKARTTGQQSLMAFFAKPKAAAPTAPSGGRLSLPVSPVVPADVPVANAVAFSGAQELVGGLLSRSSVTRQDLGKLRDAAPPTPFDGDVSVQLDPRSPDWNSLRCVWCDGPCQSNKGYVCSEDAEEQMNYGVEALGESGEPWAAIRLISSFMASSHAAGSAEGPSGGETLRQLIAFVDKSYCEFGGGGGGGMRDAARAHRGCLRAGTGGSNSGGWSASTSRPAAAMTTRAPRSSTRSSRGRHRCPPAATVCPRTSGSRRCT